MGCRGSKDVRPPRGGSVILTESLAEEDVAVTWSQFCSLGVSMKEIKQFVEDSGGKRKLRGLTTKDVCDRYVKEITNDGYNMSYCEKLADEGCKEIGEANYFISHAWQYQFLDLVNALKEFFSDKPGAILWIDLFSVNQNSVPTEDINWWTSFRSTIGHIGRFVWIACPWNDPYPLTRTWCLFELYCAAASDCDLTVAMTAPDIKQFFSTGTKTIDSFYHLLDNIDITDSSATNLIDKDIILEVVSATTSFQEINVTVAKKFQGWLIDFLLISVEKQSPESNSHATLSRRQALGKIFQQEGAVEMAAEQFRFCLDLCTEIDGGKGEDSCRVYNALGAVYQSLGRFEDAMALFQKAADIKISLQGESHKDVADIYSNMALVFQGQNIYDEALRLHERALAIWQTDVDHNYAPIADAYTNMAIIKKGQGNTDEALTLYEQALEIRIAALGDKHPNVADSYYNMAILHQKEESYGEALILYEKALAIRLAAIGPIHPDIADSYNNIAVVYQLQERYDEAIVFFEKALKMRIEYFGEYHELVGNVYNNLAIVHFSDQRFDEAIECYQKASVCYAAAFGSDYAYVTNLDNTLAVLRAALEDERDVKELIDAAFLTNKY